jgi:Flp pilus assembly protein TadD
MSNSGWRLAACVLLVVLGAGCAGKSPELSSGILYIRQGNYEKAVELLDRAVAANPDSWEAHYQLAIANMELDRYEAAYPHFVKAKELSPTKAKEVGEKHYAYWYDHFMPGVTALKGQSFAEAIQKFKEAIQIDPTRGESYSNLGFAYHKTGDLEGSLGAYLKAAEMNPGKADPLLAVATVQAELKRYGDMVVTYEKVLIVDPTNKEALLGTPEGYMELGQTDRALTAYERAMQAMPTDGSLAFDVALIYYKQEDFANAASYFEKAGKAAEVGSKLQRDSIFNHAQMLIRLEDYEAAKVLMEALVGTDPEVSEYWDQLGRIYFQLGDQKKGMAAFEKAKALEK